MMTEEVRKIGPWIVKDTLGEGGFSKVKLGVHEKTGEKVALKLLKTQKVDKASRKQVEREIAAMSKLDHTNVLRLRDINWDAVYTKKNGKKMNVILVVLELATGGELFEFLSFTGCFDEAIARTYFTQLINGVEYCHKQGIAHRDLKPENLLLNDDFVLKIADFGFSNAMSAAKMYTECGTPGYMAPELFTSGGKGYDGSIADIWACGVILFIMLSGFPPFQKPVNSDWWFNKLANNKHALFWQAHSRSAYFSDLTKDFINKILHPEPSKRITIADLKKHPWMKGPTVSYAALVSELRRRKNTVDTEKEREKERKRQERVALDKGVVVRGPGVWGDDELPDSPPKLAFKNIIFKDPTHAPASSALTFSDDSTQPKRADPAPLPAIARYTRFPASAKTLTPAAIVDRLIDVARGNSAKFLSSPDCYRVRMELGDVALVAEVFADPENKEQYVVDFRRSKGDAVEFREKYQDFRAQLADVVLQPKTAEAASADSDAMSD